MFFQAIHGIDSVIIRHFNYLFEDGEVWVIDKDGATCEYCAVMVVDRVYRFDCAELVSYLHFP